MGIIILAVSAPSLSDCLTGSRVDSSKVWMGVPVACIPSKTRRRLKLKKGPAEPVRDATKQRGGAEVRASLTAVFGSIYNSKSCVLIKKRLWNVLMASLLEMSMTFCAYINTPCSTVCIIELKIPRSHLIHMHTMNNTLHCGKY